MWSFLIDLVGLLQPPSYSLVLEVKARVCPELQRWITPSSSEVLGDGFGFFFLVLHSLLYPQCWLDLQHYCVATCSDLVLVLLHMLKEHALRFAQSVQSGQVRSVALLHLYKFALNGQVICRSYNET